MAQRVLVSVSITICIASFAVSGRTFIINIFLGDVPEDASTWESSAERVGVITIFGGGLYSSGKCSNCNKQAERDDTRLVTGQISITNALLDIIETGKPVSGHTLDSLEREDVGKFLKKALHWRVSTVRLKLGLLLAFPNIIYRSAQVHMTSKTSPR